MINYALKKRDFVNNKQEKTYVAVVKPGVKVSTQMVCNKIAERINQSPHVVRLIIEELKEILAKEIADGNSVNIEGLGAFKPSIKGLYNPEDRIPAEDLSINTSLRVSPILVKKINDLAHPQRATTVVDAPTITRISDNTTDSEDEVVPNEQGQYVVMVEGVLPRSVTAVTEVIPLDAEGNLGEPLAPTAYQSTFLRDHFNQENRLMIVFSKATTSPGNYLICYTNKDTSSQGRITLNDQTSK